MRYLSVAEIAKKWNVSERSVRNYCAQERRAGTSVSHEDALELWQIIECHSYFVLSYAKEAA